MAAQPEPVFSIDDVTLRGMQAEVTTDLAAFFQGVATDDQRVRLDDWLDSIQPPSSIARLAGQAAAAVLVAFERGYCMSDSEREASDETAPFTRATDIGFVEGPGGTLRLGHLSQEELAASREPDDDTAGNAWTDQEEG